MAVKLDRGEPAETGSLYAGVGTYTTSAGVVERAPRFYRVAGDPRAARGFYYTVVEGDRIDNIATAYLGDSRLWPLLADLNYANVDDFTQLKAGTQLYVPYMG